MGRLTAPPGAPGPRFRASSVSALPLGVETALQNNELQLGGCRKGCTFD